MLLTIASSFSFFVHAQVGIGTTSPSPSSALEIKSANSGLLIPRITLQSTTDVATILNPAVSLLIYNTATVSDVTPGFYYWDGIWKRLDKATASAGVSTDAWSLTGNTLTTGNEYLGTNNYNSLAFKVNNNAFGKFHPNGGVALGRGAASHNDNSIAIGSNATATNSNEAVAIGNAANGSGYQSFALGINATASNNETVALGRTAVASGYRSISIGVGATTSNNNALALGNASVASGEQATALGTQANSSGQNATAIGYQATATQANSIVLGNSSNANNKIGIGTNTPDERLHIVGSVKIVDGNQANGKVLVSDTNGKATWTDLNAKKYYGEIYSNSNATLNSGAVTMGVNGVSFGVTLNSTNIQVQNTGLYRISYTISLRKNSGSVINPEFYLGIYGSEVAGSRTYTSVSNGETKTISIVKLVNLNAYQAIGVYSNLSDSNTVLLANGCNLIVEFIKYILF